MSIYVLAMVECPVLLQMGFPGYYLKKLIPTPGLEKDTVSQTSHRHAGQF